MLDWRKFSDEVPTEPRRFIVRADDDSMVLLVPKPCGGWVLEHDESATLESCVAPDFVFVLETFGWSHWAYVSPPEAT